MRSPPTQQVTTLGATPLYTLPQAEPFELREGESELAITVEWGGFEGLFEEVPDWPMSMSFSEEEEMLFDYLMPHRKKNILRCSDGTAYSDFIASSLEEYSSRQRAQIERYNRLTWSKGQQE